MTRFTTTIILIAATSPLLVAGDSDIPGVSETIVVTGQAEPVSSKEAIHRVKVLASEELEAHGILTLRDLMRHELTVETDQHSVFGASPSMQGLSTQDVKILIDGVPLVGRLNGIIDLDQISLDAFQRVELIEGTTSVYYGTDSHAGVINLIPKASDGGDTQIRLSGKFDSVGETNQHLGAAMRIGSIDSRIDYSARDFDGVDLDGQRQRNWNSRGLQSLSAFFSRLVGSQRLGYSAHVFDDQLLDLGPVDEGSAKDLEYDTRRSMHQLFLRGAIGDSDYLDLSLSYSDYRREHLSFQTDIFSGTRQEVEADPDTNTFDETRFKGIWSHQWSRHKVFGGLDLVHEDSTGGRILSGSQSIDDFAFFGGARFDIGDHWHVQPSFRAADNSAFDAPITPALHVLHARGDTQTRFSYSRGFRAPSIKELYLDFHMRAGPFVYDITGNTNLEPEQGDHWEISHQRQFEGWNARWTWSSRAYLNRMENLIALSQLVPVAGEPGHFTRHYVNVDDNQTEGARTSIAFERGWLESQVAIAYANQFNGYSRTYDVSADSDRLDGTCRFRISPPASTWRSQVALSHRGPRQGFFEQDDALVITQSCSIQLVDASVSKTMLDERLRVQAGVRNALDVDSVDFVNSSGQPHSQDAVAWGRSYYLDVSWTWKTN